jgi:putative ABC transport system permease protein
VLGASVPDFLLLLCRDLIGLIVIADLIALPLTYWGGNKWLESYSFRIYHNAWTFIIPTIIVLLIALFTISFQAIKAALANPVQSRRTDG